MIIKDLLASSLSLKHNKHVMEKRDNARDPKGKVTGSGHHWQYLKNKTTTSIFDDGSSGVGKNRILVVDDETDVILTLRTILQESGFEVVSFNDPLLALRAFKPHYYDLVILDIKMPF